MKAIFQLFITFYLVVFLIGGGRVCSCEVLELVGSDHSHHSPNQCHHGQEPCSDHNDAPTDHDHSPDDCCELLTPIESDLPRTLEIPDSEELASIDATDVASPKDFYHLHLSFEKWYSPPPDDWADFNRSLPALQRFLV